LPVNAPLGPNQERWLSRIRAAGGEVEMDIYRNGLPVLWILVPGGESIRLPTRMFESLAQRDLFKLTEDRGTFKRWSLIGRENSGG
jgi:hypothetical protein